MTMFFQINFPIDLTLCALLHIIWWALTTQTRLLQKETEPEDRLHEHTADQPVLNMVHKTALSTPELVQNYESLTQNMYLIYSQ